MKETATEEQIKLFSDLIKYLKANLTGIDKELFDKALELDSKNVETMKKRKKFASQKDFFPNMSIQIDKYIANGFIDLNKFIDDDGKIIDSK